MRFKEFCTEAQSQLKLGDPKSPAPAGYKRWGIQGKVILAPASMTGEQVSAAIEADPSILSQPVIPPAGQAPSITPAVPTTPSVPSKAIPKVIIGDITKPAPAGYKKVGVGGQVVYALNGMTNDEIVGEIESNPRLSKAVNKTVSKGTSELNTPQAQQLIAFAKANGIQGAELTEFLAQAAHETLNFTKFTEIMNFTAEGLLKTHKKYFNAKTAKAYANKPQQIANRVYANRMGNGDEKSGDGWKYRGRGYLHLTGKDNYARAGQDLKIDLVSNPDLVNQFGTNGKPGIAEQVALWYWKHRVQPKIKTAGVSGATAGINPAGQGAKERLLKRSQYQQAGI